MKKWLKRILLVIGGLLGLLVLVVAVFVAWNWSSLQILFGTEGVDGAQTTPDEVASTQSPTTGEHDWPAWRGARNDARSTGTGIRKEWSGGLEKVWEVDFLCQGNTSATWSAPVVRGNRLVVPGRDETRDLVFAIDPLSGDLVWQGAYEAPAGTSHGPGPRATPFIDDNRVYTFGRSGDLVCWDIDNGDLLWRRNVRDEGGEEPTWGFSSSPLVYEGKVFVQAGGQARTIAYDAMSGELVWKSGAGLAGYAEFALLEGGEKVQLVVFHGTGLAGLDPSDGSILWDLPWLTSYDVNASTPVVIGNKVLITSGYSTGSQLVRVLDDGAEVVWKSEALAAHHTDPYIIEGSIFGYSGDSAQNRGDFKCLDLATGNERWSSDEIGWGTCCWVDQHLICIDIKGNLALVKPDSERFVKVTGLKKALGDIRGPVWTARADCLMTNSYSSGFGSFFFSKPQAFNQTGKC
jgi:outer membrane protein assembly factor BamB